MTAAPVPQNADHSCTYLLWSVNRWVSVSECHYGQAVDLPVPGLKPGTHGFRYAEVGLPAPTKPGRAA